MKRSISLQWLWARAVLGLLILGSASTAHAQSSPSIPTVPATSAFRQ